jgi:hypothetical protein
MVGLSKNGHSLNKKSIAKFSDDSSVYAHADDNTNVAHGFTNRFDANLEVNGSLSDGDEDLRDQHDRFTSE